MVISKVAFLVDGLYRAAIDRGDWPRWLRTVCEVLDAPSGALIFRLELGVRDVDACGEVLTHDLDQTEQLLRDQTLLGGLLAMGPMEVRNLSESLPQAEFLRSQLYTSLMRPQSLRHLLIGVLERTPSNLAGFVFLRRKGSRPFGKRQIDLFSRVAPHLQRAVRVKSALESAALKTRALEQIFDKLGVGTALVDPGSHVLETNHHAALLFSRKEGLWLELGRLRAENANESAALKRAISNAASRGRAFRDDANGRVLAISRRAPKVPLVVVVASMQAKTTQVSWLESSAAARLTIADPSQLERLTDPALFTAHKLTPAETRVAACLAQAKSPASIAAESGVTIHTVRAQIRQILAKTEAHGQVDLVRILLADW